MSLVSFVKATRTDFNDLRKNILKCLKLIEYDFPRNIENVIIKPNMCYYWDYSTGQTTDPRFVKALIDVIRSQVSKDVNISIVESDASAMKCKYAFKILGYDKLAEQEKVKLINLSEDTIERTEVTAGKLRFSLLLPQTIRNADLKINVPKIKYTESAKISCALKNIFGSNPAPSKFRYHPWLNETIVALNKLMKFDLSILDGIIVSGNKTRKLGLIMASQDIVAFDTAAAEIAGVNAKSIRHITLASEEGLGNVAYIPRGVDPKFFAKKYPKKKVQEKVLQVVFKLLSASKILPVT